MESARSMRQLLVMAAAGVLSACAGLQEPPPQTATAPWESSAGIAVETPATAYGPESQGGAADEMDLAASAGVDAEVLEDATKIYRGTGRFVKAASTQPDSAPKTGGITLNFENTDLREVVKIILGDTLSQNYILDPGVRGGVTMQTGRPLSRDMLLPLLETLLRMNGSALFEDAGTYHVVPVGKAAKGNMTPQLADATSPLPRGYSLQVFPLRYIGVEEMQTILQPLANEGSIIRADPKRNLLLIAGTPRELGYIRDTIETFDVDWIEGLSVGFFQLQFSDMDDVLKDLQAILSGEGDNLLGGMLKVLPIESANSLLVVSQTPEYLDKAGEWIRRLDMLGGTAGDQERMFVYRVRNGDAVKIADLLGQLFEKDKKRSERSDAAVAPGLTPKEIASSPDARAADNAQQERPKTPQTATAAGAGFAVGDAEVRIVADEDNNTLLIMATPRDYQNILSVLEQLDIVPLQVHIEATIVEVQLTDELQYGLNWFFTTQHGSRTAEWGWSNGSTLSKVFPGFNWALVDSADQIRSILTAFAGDSNVNVLSAPSVMVLDNHTAKIQVGDQVPIATQQQQSTDLNSTVLNSIQYKDTGVMLSVKPRVNPGGLVTMEIEQEVSSVAQTETSGLDSPTIRTRNISSTVAVDSGQAVVLGGLIRDETSISKGGIPGLYNMPVVGALFGEDSTTNTRTELVVVLTPRVISNALDAKRITEDFRSKLRGLSGQF